MQRGLQAHTDSLMAVMQHLARSSVRLHAVCCMLLLEEQLLGSHVLFQL